jgi:hypothetical protein
MQQLQAAHAGVCERAWVRVCVCACVRACVCVSLAVCVYLCEVKRGVSV